MRNLWKIMKRGCFIGLSSAAWNKDQWGSQWTLFWKVGGVCEVHLITSLVVFACALWMIPIKKHHVIVSITVKNFDEKI